MRDKIKKFYKEHQFEVGVATGMIVACVIGTKAQKRLEAKGYKRVRPIGYDHNGMLYVQDTTGRQFHVHNHNK